jgi:plastocyanin
MKRTLAPLALAAFVLALALAPAAAAPRPKTVKVADVKFAPERLKVREGTLVRFNWVDEMNHDVTKSSGPGRPFASRTTSKPGVNFKRRFKKPGRYRLICTVHATDGMKMTLRVKRKRGRG